MSELELIVEELKALPPEKLHDAAGYIHRLSENGLAERHAALERAYGSLSVEEASELEKAIEANCERIDAADW
ncbi:MAG TPA: hypothetical protein VG733_15140 [Chthoniobacteraceae bacterium]|nr:hypothetical protein [Chthoniobacteraceae bacterium]